MIEAIIALFIIGILLLIIALSFQSDDYSEKPCDNFRSYALKDVPARCVQYFEGQAE